MLENIEESVQKRSFGCGLFWVEQADLIPDCKEASGWLFNMYVYKKDEIGCPGRKIIMSVP